MVAVKPPLAVGAAAVAFVLAVGSAVPGPTQSAHPFGVGQSIPDAGGSMAIYTVTALAPSVDEISTPVAGLLFAATVTVEARRGSITPRVEMFTARAPSGRTYPGLPAPDVPTALNTNRLQQGQRSIGRVYFDVVDDQPDTVVLNNGMADLVQWSGPVPDTATPWARSSNRPDIPRMLAPVTTPVPA